MRRIRNESIYYLHQLLATGAGRALLAFCFLYLLLVQFCKHAFDRDPTSAFFDPSKAYKHRYSWQRRQQADSFIDAANSSTAYDNQVRGSDLTMCLGMTTVKRTNEQYVHSAYGSLMEGLAVDERKQIYSTILIGHTNPEYHPIYHEPWLRLTNNILTYNTSDKKQMDLLLKWEQEEDYRRKAIYDYAYLLKSCVDSGAAWVAIVEDDIIAVAGWYPRTMLALNIIESMSKNTDWLYLRLFFTEQFLGWNSEFWPTYLLASVAIVLAVASLLLILRGLRFHTSISGWIVLTVCFVCTPACILLYFMAGRVSMIPMAPGVHEMSEFGCCGQGLIFSSDTAGRVRDKLEEKELGFVDMIIEEWANEEKLRRYAIVPSLLQHVGGHSSKGNDFSPAEPMSVAERIFNFGFELYRQDGDRVIHPAGTIEPRRSIPWR
ncbi:MAG: hypothetical protein LQ346_006208 [Caloplaca aetnensis]|nr:MAG: hypothetical protein LQ346_006208 [Caloplaca aetnensis]